MAKMIVPEAYEDTVWAGRDFGSFQLQFLVLVDASPSSGKPSHLIPRESPSTRQGFAHTDCARKNTGGVGAEYVLFQWL